MALRERLLPSGERQTIIAASALDTAAWVDTRPELITAQGLLMYLDRDAVHGLLRALPPATLLFDGVSKRLAAHSGKAAQRLPAAVVDVRRSTRGNSPRCRSTDLERVRIPHGRGAVAGVLVPLLNRALKPISVYRARTIAASSSSRATPAMTSTAASSTNAASAARDATRATRRDA